MLPVHSIFAPIITPFESSGAAVDATAFSQQLNFVEAAGLTGVLVLGTNGEFAQLSRVEKLELVALVEQHEQLKIIVGGTVPDSPEETLALCATLNEYGSRLSGILVAPPFYAEYSRGHEISAATVAKFYGELARLVADVPLFLYNTPLSDQKQTTAAVGADVLELLGDATIAGVKDSTGNLDNVPKYLATRANLTILIGNDHAISAGMSAGARGSITACANVFPGAVKLLYQQLGKPAQAQAQAELSALRGVLEIVPGKMVAVQKLLLHLLGVVEQLSPVRMAGGSLTELEQNKVLDRIDQICQSLDLNQTLARTLTQHIADY